MKKSHRFSKSPAGQSQVLPLLAKSSLPNLNAHSPKTTESYYMNDSHNASKSFIPQNNSSSREHSNFQFHEIMSTQRSKFQVLKSINNDSQSNIFKTLPSERSSNYQYQNGYRTTRYNNMTNHLTSDIMITNPSIQYSERKKNLKNSKSVHNSTHYSSFNESVTLLDTNNQLYNIKKSGIKDNYLIQDVQEIHPKIGYREVVYPHFEMKDRIPKTLDFFELRSCYLWISCKRKRFPIHIFSDLEKVEFSFFINFDCISKSQVEEENDPFREFNLSGDDHIPAAFFNKHDEKFEDWDKPTQLQYDVTYTGNMQHVALPKKMEQDNQKDVICNKIIVLVVSPKPLRSSFSISFTSIFFFFKNPKKAEKYLILKEKVECEVFSKNHRQQLFGETDSIHQKIRDISIFFLLKKQKKQRCVTIQA